ncbi:HAMP domain-containing histidine kinase [Sphingomonas donggukensis]|uniref:histidine kinase n=1 Tax=Sphingomonas donggukensis TaxID=2949093 RepID=A0ABY4TQP5_9SPHN|nr:HAMP domain-containing sensor histidine kinase [Sphingomonas donggukensis]URW74700.1 HAMP domain-containing histidine kinase [Sphingomonas donggukensis]
MKLIPRSIHGRMLALSLLATLVALAVAGAAIFGVLERFVTQGLDQRLDAELSLLATAVDRDGSVDRARLAQVQGALDGGRGWQWRIVAPGGSVVSADFPVLDAPPAPGRPPGAHGPPPVGPGRMHPAEGHDRAGRRLHARSLMLSSTAGPVTLTAAAPWQVVVRPVRGALVPLLATLGILGLALALAALVQLRLGLRPLRRLAVEVAAIRQGHRATVSEDQPDELRPLATELNALARDTAAALDTARASAANLAHALKTPVATLALELRDHAPRAAQVERIYATIRHHLARARGGIADTRSATPLAPAITDLVAAIARLHAPRGLSFTQDVSGDVAVAIAASDLDELAGNLIDNAARHAASSVAITARVEAGLVRLTVSDDGPGIPAADRARATAPGVRLDMRGDGDGFGLSIARDLAELHGGALSLDTADGGGLAATVTLRRAV